MEVFEVHALDKRSSTALQEFAGGGVCGSQIDKTMMQQTLC